MDSPLKAGVPPGLRAHGANEDVDGGSRCFSTQAFKLAFKDSFKHMFTKHNAKTKFGKYVANLISGSLTAASSMTIVYPLDYAHTRLASDVNSGKKFH